MNETQNAQNNNGDSLTFDYNKLYANNNQPTTPIPQTAVTSEPIAPIMQEAPIIFEEKQNIQPEIVKNVIPTFDTRVLEGEDATNLETNESLINSMKSETQQENEQYKKNLGFILIFFGVLIFAVLFIFPMLAGY